MTQTIDIQQILPTVSDIVTLTRWDVYKEEGRGGGGGGGGRRWPPCDSAKQKICGNYIHYFTITSNDHVF